LSGFAGSHQLNKSTMQHHRTLPAGELALILSLLRQYRVSINSIYDNAKGVIQLPSEYNRLMAFFTALGGNTDTTVLLHQYQCSRQPM